MEREREQKSDRMAQQISSLNQDKQEAIQEIQGLKDQPHGLSNENEQSQASIYILERQLAGTQFTAEMLERRLMKLTSSQYMAEFEAKLARKRLSQPKEPKETGTKDDWHTRWLKYNRSS